MDASFNKKDFKCKFDYCIGKAAKLADPSLQPLAQNYKRRLSSSMRAISGQDVGRIRGGKGFFVSRKYDGEFALVVFDGSTIISLHPSGTVRSGLPCLDEAAERLKKAKVKSCVFAAEYYLPAANADARSVQQVIRVLRKPASKAALDEISLAVFDIVELDDKPLTSAAKVYGNLDKYFDGAKRVHTVEYKEVSTTDAIMEMLVDWVIGEGAEGLVVRSERTFLYKIKLRHNLDVAIIGYSEGVEHRKGMLHDLLVAVVRTDGTYQELTRVGGGFSDAERKDFVKDLKKRIAPSEYVAVNNDYIAYEMIEPGPVIEISCLDLIPEKTKGGPVNRMVLEWTGKKYHALQRMPLVSVISPQFVRLRDDKEAGKEDASIRQISDLVRVTEIESSADDTKLKPSKLIERTVYTKVMKDNLMVRKLLLWKTNKEDTNEFPAYVVYLTDFSPNRKTPLERDIKVAHSLGAARRMYKALSDKYFVGGWEEAK